MNLTDALGGRRVPHYFGQRVVGLGDSIMAGNGSDTSWFEQACIHAQGRWLRHANIAVGGANALDLIATPVAAAGHPALGMSQLDYALTCPAEAAVVAVGTNDVGQGVAFALYRERVATLVTRLQVAGKRVYLCAIPPRSTGQGTVAEWNAWLKFHAMARGAFFLDLHTAVTTAAGALAPALAADGTHPNAAGARALGLAVAGQVAHLARHPPLAAIDAAGLGNLLADAATFPGADAALPASWVNTVTAGAAPIYGRSPEEGVGRWLTIASADPAYAGSLARGPILPGAATYAPGDRLAVALRVRQSGGSFRVQINNPGGATAQRLLSSNFAAIVDEGVLYGEITVPAGATSLTFVFIHQGAGMWQIARPAMVNLSKLGLL